MKKKPSPDFRFPVNEMIRNRWSPRAFSGQPMEESTIMSLFEAAQWAASAMNEQPWRFIYAVKNDTVKYEKIFSCLNDANKNWAGNAPLLIITFISTLFKKTNEINKWAMHDLGLAIGNLTMQASSLNLYVHSMAGFSPDTVRAEFSIPADTEPVTVLAVGYLGNPDMLPEKLKEREMQARNRIPINELFL